MILAHLSKYRRSILARNLISFVRIDPNAAYHPTIPSSKVSEHHQMAKMRWIERPGEDNSRVLIFPPRLIVFVPRESQHLREQHSVDQNEYWANDTQHREGRDVLKIDEHHTRGGHSGVVTVSLDVGPPPSPRFGAAPQTMAEDRGTTTAATATASTRHALDDRAGYRWDREREMRPRTVEQVASVCVQ